MSKKVCRVHMALWGHPTIESGNWVPGMSSATPCDLAYCSDQEWDTFISHGVPPTWPDLPRVEPVRSRLSVPRLVMVLCQTYGAWVIGSAAEPRRTEQPRDWDVVVSFSRWAEAAPCLPADAIPNSFRGWKCDDAGTSVDVWPDDLARLMSSPRTTHLWHPASGARWSREVR